MFIHTMMMSEREDVNRPYDVDNNLASRHYVPPAVSDHRPSSSTTPDTSFTTEATAAPCTFATPVVDNRSHNHRNSNSSSTLAVDIPPIRSKTTSYKDAKDDYHNPHDDDDDDNGFEEEKKEGSPTLGSTSTHSTAGAAFHLDDHELFSDVPIHNEENGCSLPTPEEVNAMDGGSNKRKHCGSSQCCGSPGVLVVAVVLACFCLVIALGSWGAFTHQTSNANQPPPSQTPSQPLRNGGNGTTPSAPSLTPTQAVMQYLYRWNVSTVTALNTSNSPQRQAALWLATQDDLQLIPPSLSTPPTLSNANASFFVTRYALAVLFYALNGESWANSFGFLTKDNCQWNNPIGMQQPLGGVYCNSQGQVIALYLGTFVIPPVRLLSRMRSKDRCLFCLTALIVSTLSLSLTDSIHLELSVGSNMLVGSIPTELALLTTLRELNLGENSLRGNFIPGICALRNLQYLNLEQNQFLGSLPSCLSGLTALQSIHLANNQFTGVLPDLAPLTNVTFFQANNNRLRGNVSGIFDQMTNLQALYLSSNNFTGVVDDTFLPNSPALVALDLSINGLGGTLPSHLLSLSSLQVLDMRNNRLVGSLPENIHNNTALRYLALQNNSLTGSIPTAVITNQSKLIHLDLASNYLDGDMPTQISTLSNLQYLSLGDNDFNMGPIPSQYSALTGLQAFFVPYSNRNGSLPTFFSNFLGMTALDLGNNSLTGYLPWQYGQLTQLQYLILNQNNIGGSIPAAYNKLMSLQTVMLDRTSVTLGYDNLCSLPYLSQFNRMGGAMDGVNQVSADCGGTPSPLRVNCTCCDICCIAGQGFCPSQFQFTDQLDAVWAQQYSAPLVADPYQSVLGVSTSFGSGITQEPIGLP